MRYCHWVLGGIVAGYWEVLSLGIVRYCHWVLGGIVTLHWELSSLGIVRYWMVMYCQYNSDKSISSDTKLAVEDMLCAIMLINLSSCG